MSEKYKYSVSVVVPTYNPSWERVRATLNSVIFQKGVNFEIIITDDCSKENHFEKIKDLFSRYSFTDYKLISHEKNQGTVLNFLDAAKKSDGAYIRGLGQGDMFFDEYALKDSYNDIVQNNSDVSISKAVYFEANSNPVKLFQNRRCPQDIDAYKDTELLRTSYLLNNDGASGVNMLYEHDVLVKYFEECSVEKQGGG